jgi:hypothetical protein
MFEISPIFKDGIKCQLFKFMTFFGSRKDLASMLGFLASQQHHSLEKKQSRLTGNIKNACFEGSGFNISKKPRSYVVYRQSSHSWTSSCAAA